MQKPGRKKRSSLLSQRKARRGSSPADIDAEADAMLAKATSSAESSGRAKVITISDVARRARVGESTVSRVLRNHGSVSQATREKILKAAADLNYVPNRIAG